MESADQPGGRKRRRDRFVSRPGEFEVVEPGDPGPIVLVDEDIAVTWNRSKTFRVWDAMSNGFATRLIREVNVFSVTDAPGSVEAAEEAARDWWLDYGRQATDG